MRKLSILFSFATVVALSGCALFYPNYGSNESPSDPMNPTPTASETPSSSPSPSESETAAPGKFSAKPRLLDYYVDSASGIVMFIGEVINFAEDGGECTITFYSGNTPIVQEKVSAEANVSTTQCFPLQVQLSKLPKGKGEVVVSYESEKYQGDSERFEVIIP